jgi:hypothetical protein
MKTRLILTISLLVASFVATAQSLDDIQKALKELRATRDTTLLKDRLAHLEKSESEDSLSLVYQYYAMQGNEDKTSEIAKEAIRKYPGGQFAFIFKRMAVKMESDLAVKEKLFEELREGFPGKDLGFTGLDLAMAYADAGDKKKMLEYINTFPKDRVEVEARLITSLAKKDPAGASSLMKPVMDALRAEMEDTTKDADSVNRRKKRYDYYASRYADMLMRSGK